MLWLALHLPLLSLEAFCATLPATAASPAGARLPLPFMGEGWDEGCRQTTHPHPNPLPPGRERGNSLSPFRGEG